MAENKQEGTLDLIGGPMFSGKTSELLKRLFNEAEIGLKVLYVNHSSDNRSEGPFSTHNPLYKEKLSQMSKVDFTSAKDLSEIFLSDKFQIYDVIGVDEAQFFGDLTKIVEILVDKLHKQVIVAGLNGSYKRRGFGNGFGNILELEPLSDTYTKLKSFCRRCAESIPRRRREAPFTHRIDSTEGIKIVGGKDKYMPVCRSCYTDLNEI